MKIALVGTSDNAKEALSLGSDWEIYTLNGAWGYIPPERIATHFELHDIEYLLKLANLEPEYFRVLHKLGNKTVLKQPHPQYPDAQPFRIDKVLDTYPERFLTSTPAMVLAYVLATYPELTDLGIFGIDMCAKDEYRDQRECFYYYLGIAKGRNINIHMPASCPLIKADHIYSYEQPSPVMQHIKKLKESAEREKKLWESNKWEAMKREQNYTGMVTFATELEETFKR